MLNIFFVKSETAMSDDDGDDSAATNYYSFVKAEDVEFWSVELILMTAFIGFRMKFRNAQVPNYITMQDRVVGVSYYRDDKIHVQCETFLSDTPYRFTIVLDNNTHLFNVSGFIGSLDNTDYTKLMQEIEKQFNRGYWHGKDQTPLRAKSVASKVHQIIVSLDQMTAVMKAIALEKKDAPRALTPFASQGSVRTGSGRGATRPTPEQSTRRNLQKRPLADVNPTPSSSRTSV